MIKILNEYFLSKLQADIRIWKLSGGKNQPIV